MTHDEVLRLALDGTDRERQLAREVLEERGERYAINRRLIDALHRIEALEKAATPAPEVPLTPFKGPYNVPCSPSIVTASCWLPPKDSE